MKNTEEAQMKMEIAIWKHGARKRDCTNAIRHLEMLNIKNHPDIQKAIQIIAIERKRLDNINPLDL